MIPNSVINCEQNDHLRQKSYHDHNFHIEQFLACLYMLWTIQWKTICFSSGSLISDEFENFHHCIAAVPTINIVLRWHYF